jgi:hypothetical protein
VSVIVHADGTIAGCTLDDERDGCDGRAERHEGAPIRYYPVKPRSLRHRGRASRTIRSHNSDRAGGLGFAPEFIDVAFDAQLDPGEDLPRRVSECIDRDRCSVVLFEDVGIGLAQKLYEPVASCLVHVVIPVREWPNAVVVRPNGRRELAWGSAEFRQASDLARRSAAAGYRVTLAKALTSRADRRALGAVLRAPVTTVPLRPDEAVGVRDIVPVIERCLFPNRRSQLAQFVLELPATEAEYLAGKSRQALRTNLNHASRAGIKCERLSGYEDWRHVVEVILHTRGGPERRLLETMRPPEPPHRIALYTAKDAYERPVVFAMTATFGELSYLPLLLSTPNHRGASSALWALNAFVALDGASNGTRYLTVGSALRDGPGSQYLAHRLGYRVRNLRFVSC